eukprot:PhM_4_TR18094/c6_g2_i10/m.49214
MTIVEGKEIVLFFLIHRNAISVFVFNWLRAKNNLPQAASAVCQRKKGYSFKLRSQQRKQEKIKIRDSVDIQRRALHTTGHKKNKRAGQKSQTRTHNNQKPQSVPLRVREPQLRRQRREDRRR